MITYLSTVFSHGGLLTEQSDLKIQTSAEQSLIKKQRQMPQALFVWVLVTPAILVILVIVAWPLAKTFRLSFTDAPVREREQINLLADLADCDIFVALGQVVRRQRVLLVQD
jgi:hypothetical protein